MAHEIRQIDDSSVSQLISIADRDPVGQCFLGARLELTRMGMKRPTYPDLLGYFENENLESAIFMGANLIPIKTTESARKAFIPVLKRNGRRSSSITGPADEVLPLWDSLEQIWGSAREVKPSQPLFATSQRAPIQIDEQVRYSKASDLDLLYPACVSMFTEEVGVSPIGPGTGSAYRNRIAELISNRHSFVRIENEKVVFKAEVGTIGNNVAQIQGVWVNPEMRGQGIAAPAMAAVIKFILDDIAGTASLYANDFNKPAIAAYLKTGFTQVGTFATVHF